MVHFHVSMDWVKRPLVRGESGLRIPLCFTPLECTGPAAHSPPLQPWRLQRGGGAARSSSSGRLFGRGGLWQWAARERRRGGQGLGNLGLFDMRRQCCGGRGRCGVGGMSGGAGGGGDARTLLKAARPPSVRLPLCICNMQGGGDAPAAPLAVPPGSLSFVPTTRCPLQAAQLCGAAAPPPSGLVQGGHEAAFFCCCGRKAGTLPLDRTFSRGRG